MAQRHQGTRELIVVIKLRVQLIRYHDLDNMNTRLASSLNKKQGVLPPLGLAYIASALEKAGHQVDLIDAIALCLSKEQVEDMVKLLLGNIEIIGPNDVTDALAVAICHHNATMLDNLLME